MLCMQWVFKSCEVGDGVPPLLSARPMNTEVKWPVLSVPGIFHMALNQTEQEVRRGS